VSEIVTEKGDMKIMTFNKKVEKNSIFNLSHWQKRLDELRDNHHVPGASLAVLIDGNIYKLASGLLHRGTGVETTTDSVFHLGSIAKIYTATLIMKLVDLGELDLDAKVVNILPEFAVADSNATEKITIRQLLSHTSGLTCDFNLDTGRGDDCLERYVEASKDVAMDCPPGTFSYSGVGYVVLGRIIEVITGKTWDQAMKDLLLTPLGLAETMTLPEDVLRFRAAMSHLGAPGQYPEPAPMWDFMPRSAGPAARMYTTASDLVRLAQMHLADGLAPDGTPILQAETVAKMQQRHIDVADKWTVSSDGWGLGWTLYDLDGVPGFGHDGAAIGQYTYLRVLPKQGIAIALLTNGGSSRLLYADLFRELMEELAGVKMPDAFAPTENAPTVDITPFVGTYQREGVIITISKKDEQPHLLYEFVGTMKDLSPPLDMTLIPISETVFAGAGGGASFSEDWMPVVFSHLPDGTRCCYIGMRCAPMVEIGKKDGTNENSQNNDGSREKLAEESLEPKALKGADFSYSPLGGSDLSHSDLTNSTFQGSDLSNAKLDGANLTGANLSNATLKYASLKDCIFHHTNFSHSNLSGISFENQTFHGTNFDYADLTGTSFQNAVLQNVSFQEVVWTEVNFDGAAIDKVTYTVLKGQNVDLSKVKVM
jgi:CubicO group peptidase (beta-lactamase class C family)